MNKMFKCCLCVLLLAVGSVSVFAQDAPKKNWTDIVSKGVKLKLTPTGSSYLKVGGRMQLKARYMETNPGSVDVNGKLVNNYSDFALRRMRTKFMVNYENKFIFYTQFGLSGQPLNELKQGMAFHDLYGRLTIVDKKLYWGAGLHGWRGVSRYTLKSSGKMMMLEQPGFNSPGGDNQFGRQMGFFIHGQLNRFEYQFAVNSPILSSSLKTDPQVIGGVVTNQAYQRYSDAYAVKGYASYSFLNKEKVGATPYKAMTYLGEKGKILNIGAGFQYHPGSIGTLQKNNTIKVQNSFVAAVDFFYDRPFRNNSALTIYAVYYNYQFGKNYLKASGNMSGVLDAGASAFPVGAANRQYVYGTGSILHSSIGYVIPSKRQDKIQAFYAVSYKDLEGLNRSSVQHSIGANYYLVGNHVKFSMEYATRPVYDNNMDYAMSKGELMFMVQFDL